MDYSGPHQCYNPGSSVARCLSGNGGCDSGGNYFIRTNFKLYKLGYSSTAVIEWTQPSFYPGHGCLSGNNNVAVPSPVTLEECKAACVADASCESIDWYSSGTVCRLAYAQAADGSAFTTTAQCEYYNIERSAGAGGGAAAVGDPHLQNVHGERFDLMKEGKHVLMTIPRGKDAEHALLRVQADARRMGNKCADMYFQEVNVTGVWAEAKNAGGYRYSVSQHDREAPEWVAFGKVELKVVHGRTDGGLPYLNVYMKHLRSAGVAIGGLLGEDDHEDVITPPEACTRKVALAKRQTSGQALSSASSVAMAFYEE